MADLDSVAIELTRAWAVWFPTVSVCQWSSQKPTLPGWLGPLPVPSVQVPESDIYRPAGLLGWARVDGHREVLSYTEPYPTTKGSVEVGQQLVQLDAAVPDTTLIHKAGERHVEGPAEKKKICGAPT